MLNIFWGKQSFEYYHLMISFVKIFRSALIDFECDLQMPENCLKYYHYNMRISYDFVSLVIAVRTGVLLNTLNLELMAWGVESMVLLAYYCSVLPAGQRCWPLTPPDPSCSHPVLQRKKSMSKAFSSVTKSIPFSLNCTHVYKDKCNTDACTTGQIW